MGCDIHIAVEKRVGSKWVMVNRIVYPETAAYRNYKRFASLAGVRGDGPEPRGLPDDISESSQLFVDEFGEDGHSHSWLPIKEAAYIFSKTSQRMEDDNDYAKEYPISYYFDVEESEADNYRIVFFFDN